MPDPEETPIPNPTDQSGTLDTSGIGGPAHGDLTQITPVFNPPGVKVDQPIEEGGQTPEESDQTPLEEVSEQVNTQTADTSDAGSPPNPTGPAAADASDLSDQDYESMRKDELVAMAEERGLDSSGTKAEIIERLKVS